MGLAGDATISLWSSTVLVPISVLALVAYLTWHYLTYGRSKYGPVVYPFIGTLPDILRYYPFLYDRATEILETCPSMTYLSVLPGLKEVITANPENIQHILKTHFANYPKGPSFQENFRDLLGHGIFNSDGDTWKQQRKTASLEFSTNSLRHLMLTSIQEEVRGRLMPTLEQAARTGQPLDLQDVLLRYTFDNICRIGFGVDPGCLAPDLPDIPFAKAFDMATKVTMQRNIMAEPVWKLMRLMGWGMESHMKEAVQAIDDFTAQVIQKRRQEMADKEDAQVSPSKGPLSGGREVHLGKVHPEIEGAQGTGPIPFAAASSASAEEHTDILSRMIALDKQDQGQLYSDTFLRDACTNFILAGRDTSSVVLSWLFWLLTWHPEVEERMISEIDDIVRARGDGGENSPFTFDELKGMTYTHAAINEALRLYPSVPADSKYVLRDDVLPDGTEVKKGWRVMYAIYAVGRMTRVWGEDAREFKPERWLNAAGQVKLETAFKFPAFNGGPRLCLGKDMAYMQMKSVAANVLRKYKLRLVPGHKVEYALSLTLFMKNGLKMHVVPRDV